MALPLAPAAYTDCYDHFERAQRSERGIRILSDSYEAAFHLRSRMNQARVIERRESARIYPRADPKHAKSENDCFKLTLVKTAEDDGKWWIYVQRWDQTEVEIEEL